MSATLRPQSSDSNCGCNACATASCSPTALPTVADRFYGCLPHYPGPPLQYPTRSAPAVSFWTRLGSTGRPTALQTAFPTANRYYRRSLCHPCHPCPSSAGLGIPLEMAIPSARPLFGNGRTLLTPQNRFFQPPATALAAPFESTVQPPAPSGACLGRCPAPSKHPLLRSESARRPQCRVALCAGGGGCRAPASAQRAVGERHPLEPRLHHRRNPARGTDPLDATGRVGRRGAA
mmetsp:Transcript_25712/g.40844  ORF Transcript_25712/g.40844 Transcript_25712/m.40844 type:complete len:234 (+) Transcript_25712:13-714(+)